jgi:hypothetical protein
MLTGPAATAANLPTNLSIDNYIADHLGVTLPWRSLYMASCSDRSISTLKDLTSQPSQRNPLTVYKNVFGAFTGGSGGPSPAVLRRLKRRQSVLDALTSDLNGFVGRLPPEDKLRAEAQLDAVRQMETMLTGQMHPPAGCSAPTAPSGSLDYASDINMPDTMRAFINITVAAFACDQTRVAMMHTYLSDDANYACRWAPCNSALSFHALSHDFDGKIDGSGFALAKGFHFQLVAELAAALKAIPEGSGTMLDNTLIFVPTEIGFADYNTHSNAGLLYVTVGGKNLGVKTGQYMMLGRQQGTCGGGVFHQRLLVSLINAMGIQTDTFGDDATSGKGPLQGYLA